MKLSIPIAFFVATLLLLSSCESEQTPVAIQIDSNQLYGARSMEEDRKIVPPVSFTIIYEKDKENLKDLLSSYQLQEDRAFDIDEDMHAIEVYPRTRLITPPIEVGKIISMQENVLMVKVNNTIQEIDTTS